MRNGVLLYEEIRDKVTYKEVDFTQFLRNFPFFLKSVNSLRLQKRIQRSSSVGNQWQFGADPDPGIRTSDWPDPTSFFSDLKDAKKYFFITYPQAHYLLFLIHCDKIGRVRNRSRIREAQKHADPADPDPQHCVQDDKIAEFISVQPAKKPALNDMQLFLQYEELMSSRLWIFCWRI
jgi:hypothetical protein